MTARLDGKPRSDKGSFRKYATAEDKIAARRQQRIEARRRYRDSHREELRLKGLAYNEKNKDARSRRSKAWAAANPDRVRDTVYRRKYGITLATYDAMVAERSGCCDICGKKRKLVVDHCHDSRRIRGLLCDRCNVGLGCFGDDPITLGRAKGYVAQAACTLPHTKLAEDRIDCPLVSS